MPRTVRISHLAVLIGLFLLFRAAAQKTSAPPPPVSIPDFSRLDVSENQQKEYQEYEKGLLTFSTKAQYVLVPAVVTDKTGHPISGLRKEDFRLQENGKE